MTSISKPKPVLGLSDDSPAQAFQMWHQHVEAKWNKPNKLHVRDKKYAADDLTFWTGPWKHKNFQILRPPKFLCLEGCSTVATRMPRDQKVTSSNPAECCIFSSSSASFLSSVCFNRSLEEVQL